MESRGKYSKALQAATGSERTEEVIVRDDGTVRIAWARTGLIFADRDDRRDMSYSPVEVMIRELPILSRYKRQESVLADTTTWTLYYPDGADVRADVDNWREWMNNGGGPVKTLNLEGWGVVPNDDDGEGHVKVAEVWDPLDPETWCDDDCYGYDDEEEDE